MDALLLESRQVRLSAAALSLLAEQGCTVFLCDEKHMPSCVLTPFMGHSRQLGVLRQQLALTEPRKKRLWQQLVVRKIGNQSRCLSYAGREEEAAVLARMADGVGSGDSGNLEATAAAYYFPRLFGTGFTRSGEDGRNAALNYGYAILRGCVARTLTVYGLLPCMGLHHRSELNPFNLADDFIEPFRPLVDSYVAELPPEAELTQDVKRALFALPGRELEAGGKRYSASYCAELAVQSLLRSMKEPGEPLQLPELLPQEAEEDD